MSDQADSAGDQARLRISDAERHQVAEVLREAAGEGRLSIEELDERLEATFAARTYADLVPITVDLPITSTGVSTGLAQTRSQPEVAGPAAPDGRRTPARIVPGPERDLLFTVMGGLERRGDWVVPVQLGVVAVMGGVELDLRRARFAAPEVTITLTCLMGGVVITVGPDVRVVVHGVGIMGSFSSPRGDVDEPAPDAPVVHVRGVAIMGGVDVKRRGQPVLPTGR